MEYGCLMYSYNKLGFNNRIEVIFSALKNKNMKEEILYKGAMPPPKNLWEYAIELSDNGWEVFQAKDDETYDMKLFLKNKI